MWAAQAVLLLANVARKAGEYPSAGRLYAEAEALARPTGDTYALGAILDNRAVLAQGEGDSRLARRLGEEALALHRAHGDRQRIGHALAALGRVALAEGDAATAHARLTEALTVLRDAGLVWDVPPHLRELAQVAAAQGQPERAARLWGAAAAQHQVLLGRPLPADEGPTLAQATESLRARLGAASFAAAWEAGQALPLEQAVADALAEAEAQTTPAPLGASPLVPAQPPAGRRAGPRRAGAERTNRHATGVRASAGLTIALRPPALRPRPWTTGSSRRRTRSCPRGRRPRPWPRRGG